ncbi:MAG: flagellar motor switch protein FliN [Oceanococcaceae bacterium]
MSDQEMSAAEAEMVAAMEAQAQHEEQQKPAAKAAAKTQQYEPPAFEGAADSGGQQGKAGNVNLDMILDVPITLSMEVGRSRLPIRNLMQLNPGSVVELDRVAGQPLDVFVNGTLIAHGEVVVVNEKFGVRLIDVVSPAERIRKLQS